MQRCLEAIGFSSTNKKWKDIDNILKQAVDNPDCSYVIGRDKEDTYIEYIKYFGKDIGIVVRGFLDDRNEVIIESWAPYIDTSNKTEIIEVDIDKDDKDEYYAVCEEEETGNEIVFYLQNVVDFLSIEDNSEISVSGAYIVGLAEIGTIILPIEKDFMDKVMECEQDKLYRTLVRRAREGDNEAEQILQLQQDQMTETISERLNNEDLYSVVEGYFLSDDEIELTYDLLGTIQKIEIIRNNITNEKIYKLNLNAMGTNIDVCINKKNLLGIPTKGMRFKGKCWIQGRIVFE